jgi:hypothetical protein
VRSYVNPKHLSALGRSDRAALQSSFSADRVAWILEPLKHVQREISGKSAESTHQSTTSEGSGSDCCWRPLAAETTAQHVTMEREIAGIDEGGEKKKEKLRAV